MYAARRWSVRNARLFESLYALVGSVLTSLDPLWRTLGYGRVEKPMVVIERSLKGFLFDCRMCGQCVLGRTGMACPMNCPKELRNGPCGGVREGGFCEIKADMRCVWVEAWEGSRRMRHGGEVSEFQVVVDNTLRGSSSWLRAARVKAREQAEAKTAELPPNEATGRAEP